MNAAHGEVIMRHVVVVVVYLIPFKANMLAASNLSPLTMAGDNNTEPGDVDHLMLS